MTLVWDGELPVPEEYIQKWHSDGVDLVAINYVNDIYTLIDYDDMDACNADMDEITGVNLMSLSYTIDIEGTKRLWESNGDDVEATSFVMRVEGEIDWSSYEFEEEE